MVFPKYIRKTELIIATLLVSLGVVLRLLPHSPNFAPIAAIALFSGVYLSGRLAILVPVLAMLISDLFLGFYEPVVGVAVYGCFIFSFVLGTLIRKNKKWHTVLGGSLVSSITFFAVTNFAVWAFTPWYAKTFSGLLNCYTMAAPFFKGTLLGDFFYTGLFFGVYELAWLWIKLRSPKIALQNN